MKKPFSYYMEAFEYWWLFFVMDNVLPPLSRLTRWLLCQIEAINDRY